MDLSKYLLIQQIVMGGVIVLGGHLLLDSMPRELNDKYALSSSQFMGLGICAIPIASFIYYFFEMKDWGAQYATAINLIAYTFASIFISIAFLILTEKRFNQTFIKYSVGLAMAYTAVLWGGLNLCAPELDDRLVVIAYTMYCMLVVSLISICIYKYIKRKDIKTEGQQFERKWFGRAIGISLYLISVSVLSPSFFSYPLWLGQIFVVSFVGGIIALYICYRRLIVRRAKSVFGLVRPNQFIVDEDELESPKVDSTNLSAAIQQHIEDGLNRWIDEQKYCQSNISIISVSKDVYTNRTYLSKYINTKYGCSFRVWLTTLRLEEAKQILSENHTISMEEVAEQIGAASLESFTQAFVANTGMSPKRWRDNH